jgi:hypothetical protein
MSLWGQWLGHAPCLTLNRPTMRSSSVEPSSSSPVLPLNRLKVCSQSSKLSNSDSSSLGYTWVGQAVRPQASILPHLLPPTHHLDKAYSQALTLSSSILAFFFSGASDPWPGPGLWFFFFFSSFAALDFSLLFIGPFRPGPK